MWGMTIGLIIVAGILFYLNNKDQGPRGGGKAVVCGF